MKSLFTGEPVPDTALVGARISDVTVEQQTINKILVTVHVQLGSNTGPAIALASGTLKEMCVLFNCIPYKGKFLTAPLKNKSCMIYLFEGKYIFQALAPADRKATVSDKFTRF